MVTVQLLGTQCGKAGRGPRIPWVHILSPPPSNRVAPSTQLEKIAEVPTTRTCEGGKCHYTREHRPVHAVYQALCTVSS